jgi:hypothetical protein
MTEPSPLKGNGAQRKEEFELMFDHLDWLHRTERLGWITIHRPRHAATGLRYGQLVIRYAFLGGNILPECGDGYGPYDEAESVARYAAQCHAALEHAYPGAKIEVSYQLHASGGSGDEMCVEDTELGRMADRVQELIWQVWVSWEWPVYMADAATIVAQLNAYTGDDVWEDVIRRYPGYDDVATEAADPYARGGGTVIVLLDDSRIEWDEDEKEWRIAR